MGFPHVCEKLRLLGVDVDGAFAEYVRASWQKVYRIPPGPSDETASLTEPTAVAVHVVGRSGLSVGETVVILGGGPIGLLIAMIAEIAGASRIFVAEILQNRLKLAEQLGFEVIDSSKQAVSQEVQTRTGGRGVDVVFDAAGVPQTGSVMVSLVRPRGRIVLVGLYKKPPAVDLFTTTLKEAELIGSRVYSDIDFEKATNLIISGRLTLGPLVTHRLSLDDASEGLRLIEDGKNAMKVVLSLSGNQTC
jgi:2-desacetyl-2-hydroxyethyl bacteriochlorophyllide A dehydrogenase